MFYRNVLNLLLISSVAVSARLTPRESETKDNIEVDTSLTTTSTSTPVITKNIEICADLRPEFISTRNGRYQTLECTARICSDEDNDDDYLVSTTRFNRPIFEWNCQLGHIVATNGSCDYSKQYCWNSIDIDLRYFSQQMRDNGLNEIQLSCSVSDVFDTISNDFLVVTATDVSYLKRFRGKAIAEKCDTDFDCGNYMFCMNSSRELVPVCQCLIDFVTDVQYVQVRDERYGEWMCAPPAAINESCVYDVQCRAIDSNSICDQSAADIADSGIGKCRCDVDMVYSDSNCQLLADVTTKPDIIWWIFTNDLSGTGDKDHSHHRFRWLRAASYIIALLAIFLPLLLIILTILGLCYRRMLAASTTNVQFPDTITRPTFPAPKAVIRIEDLIRNEKSDDKYNLVKNDELDKQ